jgi:uncharacterized membrane protein YhaH (DUF805 family)
MSPAPMSFGTAIGTGFRRYAEFTGRSGLAEFWWFMLFVFLVSAAARTIDSFLPGGDVDSNGLLSNLWSLGTVIPVLAITVRRLRDGGNRWVQIFWLLVPIAGIIVLIIRLCDPPRFVSAPSGVRDAPVQDTPPRDAPIA